MCFISSVTIVQGLLEAPVLSLWSTSAVPLPWHLYFLYLEVRCMHGTGEGGRGELYTCTAEHKDDDENSQSCERTVPPNLNLSGASHPR